MKKEEINITINMEIKKYLKSKIIKLFTSVYLSAIKLSSFIVLWREEGTQAIKRKIIAIRYPHCFFSKKKISLGIKADKYLKTINRPPTITKKIKYLSHLEGWLVKKIQKIPKVCKIMLITASRGWLKKVNNLTLRKVIIIRKRISEVV